VEQLTLLPPKLLLGDDAVIAERSEFPDFVCTILGQVDVPFRYMVRYPPDAEW
jgi:hypothetical protein